MCLVVITDLALWNSQQGVRSFCACYQQTNHNITIKACSHPTERTLLRKSSQFSISLTASLHFYGLTCPLKCYLNYQYLANLYQGMSLQPRERNKRFHSHQHKLEVHFVLSNEKHSLIEFLTTPRNKFCRCIQVWAIILFTNLLNSPKVHCSCRRSHVQVCTTRRAGCGQGQEVTSSETPGT